MRSPEVPAISIRTRTVTGRALAMVSGSGASEVPSEYGLGGSSTLMELRIASTLLSSTEAADCASVGDPRRVADAGRSAPRSSGANSWSTEMPTPGVATTAVRRSARSRIAAATLPIAEADTTDISTGGSAYTAGAFGFAAARASVRPTGATFPAVIKVPTASSRSRAPWPAVPQ